jgi:hypothetical protein
MTAASGPLLNTYIQARTFILSRGFGDEVGWQATRAVGDFTESDLLRESAWVILCSGFRASAVRRIFNYISLCFCDWDSAACIVGHAATCRSTALARFNNPRKIDAIIAVAHEVHSTGFGRMREQMLLDPLNTLRRFPFIGPVTSIHLAKNLGWPLAKPDRHMLRLTRRLGFTDPQTLCESLAQLTGDPVSVVDIILWRYTVETQRDN